MSVQMKKEIFFNDKGILIVRPDLAAEIGRDASLVFQQFIYFTENDKTYLIYHMDRYWTRQSINHLVDRYFYKVFKINNGKERTREAVKVQIRRIMKYLVEDINVLLVNQFDSDESSDLDSRTRWYAIHYEMLGILKGIAVFDVPDDNSNRKVLYEGNLIEGAISFDPQLTLFPTHVNKSDSGCVNMTQPETGQNLTQLRSNLTQLKPPNDTTLAKFDTTYTKEKEIKKEIKKEEKSWEKFIEQKWTDKSARVFSRLQVYRENGKLVLGEDPELDDRMKAYIKSYFGDMVTYKERIAL